MWLIGITMAITSLDSPLPNGSMAFEVDMCSGLAVSHAKRGQDQTVTSLYRKCIASRYALPIPFPSFIYDWIIEVL